MIDIFKSCPWWLLILVGLCIGYGISFLLWYFRKDGVIHIYHSSDGERYLFEYHVPPENVPDMHQVIFWPKVETEDPQNLHTF